MATLRMTRFKRRGPAVIAVTAIVLSVLLRLPALAEPLGIDQGIFAAAGWGLDRELMLYVDLWDQKPPGIHLTYRAAFAALGPSVSTVFWLDLGAQVLVGLLLWLIGRAHAGSRLGLCVVVVWSIGSIPSIRYGLGGFLERAVAETFISGLAAAALLAIWPRSGLRRVREWALAGTLIGAAAVFKPTALIYLPAFAAASWLAFGPIGWRHLLAATLCAAIVPVATMAWLALNGALHEARLAVIDYNRAYLAVGPGLWEFADAFAHEVWRRTKTDPLWTLGMSASAVAVIRLPRGLGQDPLALFGLAWLAASAVAAAANGFRMFNAYFIPCLPPLALLGALILAGHPSIAARRGRAIAPVLILSCTLAVIVLSGIAQRIWRATDADLRVLGDPSSRVAYLERFGGYANGRGYSARANAELVEYVRTHSSTTDRIFIFGMAPGVYFEARRLPGQRFLFIGPAVSRILDRPGYSLDSLADDLAARRPTLIILEQNNRDSALGWTAQAEFARPVMRRALEDYRPVATIEDFTVYRLNPERTTQEHSGSGR